jgi:hypothetical protein
LFQDAPAVLVPRRWRYEITERIDAQGNVVFPLEEADIDAVITGIQDVGLDTVAVSCLFSFLNDVHERRIGERLRQALPGASVYLSCEGAARDPQFERASTTAVCAYVGPLLAGYLHRLQSAISERGLPRLLVMGSSGGVFDVREALRMPAMTIESGPAAGVIAAALGSSRSTKPDFLRHGRDDGQSEPDCKRRGFRHRRIRGRRRRAFEALVARHRAPHPGAGHRSRRSQRRRGQHRWHAKAINPTPYRDLTRRWSKGDSNSRSHPRGNVQNRLPPLSLA